MATFFLTAGSDKITGTSDADTFEDAEAFGGIDILDGAGGDDTFLIVGFNKGSSVDGGEGTDTLRLLTVNSLNPSIYKNMEILDINLDYQWEFYTTVTNLANIVEEFETIVDTSRPDNKIVLELIGDGGSVDLSSSIADGYSAYINGSFSKLAINVTASKGNDYIRGTGLGDRLFGDAGDDTIYVSSQAEIVSGGDGNDTFFGGLSFQASGKIDGGEGVDTLRLQGPLGNANIFNVEILDTKGIASFSASIGALSAFDTINIYNNDTEINLIGIGGVVDFLDYVKGTGSPAVSGAALTSGYTAFGTAKNDSFVGSNFNDTFYGSVGADKIYGGEGLDTVDYSKSTSAVTVRLEYTGSKGGFAEGDEFQGVEIVIGSAFSDTIEGTYRGDRLFGGAGNDVLIGGNWTDHLSGGLGIDTASYLSGTYGVRASLIDPLKNTGDARGDTYASIENLTGTRYEDELSGNNGTNVISGDSGDDILQGYAGDDKLFGGDWNDTLIGGAGADYLSGGAHFDTASYATAAKAVTASLTDSSINTGDAAGDIYNSIELLDGSAFNDRLLGNNGANLIFGDTGNDTLSGYGGNDSLLGSDGDDVLNGGVGADKLDGGSGFDTASYAQATAAVKVNLAEPSLNTGEAKGDTFNSIENLEGSAFNDTLNGNAGANTLSGGKGNDTLNGGLGADLLKGGDGTDTVTYATATEGVTASLADPSTNTGEAAGDSYDSIEVLVGSKYSDRIVGNDSAVGNKLYGGVGDDVVDGGGGPSDELNGGSGNDTLIGGSEADYFYGGAGFDTVSYANATSGVTVNFGDWSLNTGFAKDDVYYYVEYLTGSSFNDNLTGGGDGAIMGGSGNDVITDGARLFGEDGNDTLAGGSYLSGGSGTDTVSYAWATARIVASLANESTNRGEAAGDRYSSIENLTGSEFDDDVYGSNGANTIQGGAGDDTVKGYAGNDKLSGNDGDDVLNGGLGADYLSGGTGSDTASYAQAAAAVKVNLADPSLNAGEAKGDTFNSIEHLEGSAFNDTLDGNAGANLLTGLDGHDLLRGAAGNDRLEGGIGGDTLGGGDGNDFLVGGAGADYLSGGNGADTAYYADAKAGVTVSLTVPAGNAGEASGDTLNSIENLFGTHFDDRLEGSAVSNLIDGFLGNDTVAGYAGDDELRGSVGNDVLNGGAGADRLDGGDDTDTASYTDAATGVVASLADASVNTGDAKGDIYIYVENITGSAYGDSLTGDIEYNILFGGGGNDTLQAIGSGFDDTLGDYGGGDRLFGEDGNDTLTSGTGEDYLSGGSGFDTVSYANAAGSVIAALAAPLANKGEAEDDVYNSIEGLIGSVFKDGLVGNTTANKIDGGAGDDVIGGSGGNDTLTGGAGMDVFVFDSALDASKNVDVITDYTVGADTIGLDKLIFTALSGTGILSADQFAANLDGKAGDASDRIVYETDTGKLFYDADGNGAGTGIHFATIAGGGLLTNVDFFTG